MEPREIVIISGKGGTGKTSITGAFASLFKNIVLADCDVDAADLHLIMKPELLKKEDFYSGHEPEWIREKCVFCGTCEEMCRFDAISINGEELFLDLESCEGCGVCVHFCPEDAFLFKERWCGEIMVSNTRFGPMVHAKLGIGAENSGKLVSFVRQKAKEIALDKGFDKILIDGPPGIGCPVIASITGTNYVVIVVEPTVSGIHDMERVLSLAKHFNVPAGIIINKWNINEELCLKIEDMVDEKKASLLGRISYDPIFTTAQINETTIIDYYLETNQDSKDNTLKSLINEVKAIFDELNKNLRKL